VFVSLNGDRERSVRRFTEHCKKAGLIRIVDVYEARVDDIDEAENAATIELINLDGNDNFPATFDLARLKSKGIKEIDQKFEYTVCLNELDHPFGQIELTE
jgi:hypothetical protein